MSPNTARTSGEASLYSIMLAALIMSPSPIRPWRPDAFTTFRPFGDFRLDVGAELLWRPVDDLATDTEEQPFSSQTSFKVSSIALVAVAARTSLGSPGRCHDGMPGGGVKARESALGDRRRVRKGWRPLQGGDGDAAQRAAFQMRHERATAD